MNDKILRVRPLALAEYLHLRYRVQPGQGLCLVLGQPDAGDNSKALNAWVRDAVKRHDELDLCDQVQTVEKELCRLMVDAGVVDEAAIDYAVPAGLVAEIFGHKPASAAVRLPGRTRGSRYGPASEKIVPFPIRPSQG